MKKIIQALMLNKSELSGKWWHRLTKVIIYTCTTLVIITSTYFVNWQRYTSDNDPNFYRTCPEERGILTWKAINEIRRGGIPPLDCNTNEPTPEISNTEYAKTIAYKIATDVLPYTLIFYFSCVFIYFKIILYIIFGSKKSIVSN